VDMLKTYADTLANRVSNTQVTDELGRVISIDSAIQQLGKLGRQTHAAGNKIIFIGNGGSSAICSHMAIDYSKNGGMRALAFNDAAFLTCLGNDFGYDSVFTKQLECHGRPSDLLVAISSSGQSSNILKAVAQAKAQDLTVVTLSGFKASNPLRLLGGLNFYLADDNYGFVELGHLTLLHAALDMAMGWRPEIT
jgi:D-sedoheptulose 7-phosphate isomerase